MLHGLLESPGLMVVLFVTGSQEDRALLFSMQSVLTDGLTADALPFKVRKRDVSPLTRG